MEGAFWFLVGLLVVVPLGIFWAVAGPLKGTHSGKILRNIGILQLAVAVIAILVKVVRG
ncbi:hypothetical protein [Deinococcus cellulosilyticus]|uniref:Uncharacterized protein n=1 Tax=Deinococcus cellulosilyticus (strain DSM 18568 / NBRC 106333 / KACC 11606 / 5516J-15) TaxID=1223518 RepID=A0A511N5U2_DEIC1|nr:hypothetical protein [Deinococcus cellulosilyticus]GEM48225.1 hypothetical protein DC3_38600 [Deinococcus cellulosilyticus NBRC 106333 = KACC 11606]